MTARLRVAIDFRCAASYLAAAPTRALESRLGVRFDWLPFPMVTRTRPDIVVSGDDRSARHFRARSEYVANDLRRYAAARGLDLGDGRRETDTTTASLGLLWLSRRASPDAGEFVAGVFDRIWRDNAEADIAFVEGLLAADARGFRAYATGDGPRDLETTRAQLSSEGVWNVPAFLVADQLFIGRQHLPLLERLATAEPLGAESRE
jgi:2-hydroxychromene-2-carboxylate isomerase